MSSPTNAVATKLVELMNTHKQKEECHKELELEAEQEHLDEERPVKELEEMRV